MTQMWYNTHKKEYIMNEKEKKFRMLAENRVRKTLKMIKLVGNLL